jgi:hypothetical protein
VVDREQELQLLEAVVGSNYYPQNHLGRIVRCWDRNTFPNQTFPRHVLFLLPGAAPQLQLGVSSS